MKKEILRFLETGELPPQSSLVGFGSIKSLLLDDGSDQDASRIKDLIIANYGEDSYDLFRRSLLTSYYTPKEFVDRIIKPIRDRIGNDGISILEPSAGTGVFVDAFKDLNVRITAIEKDLVAGDLLKAFNGTSANVDVVVSPFERFKTKEKHDLVISNVPFGDFSVYDPDFASGDRFHKNVSSRIHNYFMVKGYESLNENGIMCVIVPSGLSDSKGNEEVRRHLVENNDLLFFNRLPIQLFRGAGTQASSDLLVFKRNMNKSVEQVKDFELKWAESIVANKIGVNRLLSEHNRLGVGYPTIGGQYGNKSMVYDFQGSLQDLGDIVSSNLGVALARQQISFSNNLILGTTTSVIPSVVREKELELGIPDGLREGNLFVHERGVYLCGERKAEPVLASKNWDIKTVEGLCDIRDAYKELLTAVQENKNFVSELDKLNATYDEFVKQFSLLSDSEISKIIEFDIDQHLLFALEEEREDGSLTKAAVFFESFYQKAERKVDDLSSAVIHSLDLYNGLDIRYLERVTGFKEKELFKLAYEQNIFYEDFVGGVRFPVLKEDYLSGDIVKRIDRIQTIEDGLFYSDKAGLLQKLKGVEKVKLPAEVLDLKLGERWIDLDIYKSFAEDLFKVDCDVIFVRSQDSFKVSLQSYSSISANEFCAPSGDGTYNGNSIMEYAMIDQVPEITKTVVTGTGDLVKIADVAKIRAFEKQVERINKRFSEFVLGNPIYKSRLEDKYHRTFNNVVLREYDGSHLTFPGLTTYVPKQSQRDAVWMLLQRNGGLVDQKVGKGKTLIMAMAAMEMRRLGLAKKPMMIGIKSNASALYMDFKRAYPHAKVLYPGEKDFAAKNRKVLLQKIMTQDFDCVILTHDQFGRIQQSPRMRNKVIKDQIKDLERDLEMLNKPGVSVSRLAKKGLEKKKMTFENRLKKLTEQMDKDKDIVDFEMMGIDHLFVDESHNFKNLAFNTRYHSVSGLGDPIGSQKAQNLFIAINTLQEYHKGDKGVTFLSGTPLSNSINEMYSLFQYLKPSELTEKSMYTFDAWASVFAVRTSDYEFSVTGEVKRKDRFREFVKVPELATMYKEMAHVDHVIDQSKEPELLTEIVKVKPSVDQLAFNEQLIQYAKTKGASGNIGSNKGENKAFMLIATNMSKKASLDMRMIDTGYDDYAGGKLNACARNVVEWYRRSNDHKGTQMVFCDIGVPNNEAKFVVYEELKRKFVEMGIPPSEITFIHEFNSDKKKAKFSELMNDGTIRVSIGSTEKMGTGVNAQKRGVALHHLELPWKPSALAQRCGRFGRPGNEVAMGFYDSKVKNYIYAGERSLDEFQFQLLANKQNFINQVKNATINSRRIDEGAIDLDGGMNFAEFGAALSGDNRLLVKARLEKEMRDILQDRDIFYQSKHTAEDKLRSSKTRLELVKARIPELRNDLENYKKLFPTGQFSEEYPFPIEVNGAKATNCRDLGMMMADEMEKMRFGSKSWEGVIAKGGGYLILYSGKDFGDSFVSDQMFVQAPSGNIKYTHSNGYISDIPGITGKYLFNCLNKIDKLLLEHEEHRVNLESDITVCNKLIGTEKFENEPEIERVKKELEKITAELDKTFANEKGKDDKDQMELGM